MPPGGGLALNVQKCSVGGINSKGLGERSYRDLKVGGGEYSLPAGIPGPKVPGN
jgi:hypothetical protein